VSSCLLLIEPKVPITSVAYQAPDIVNGKSQPITIFRFMVMLNYEITIIAAKEALEVLIFCQLDDNQLNTVVKPFPSTVSLF
jgi:hypothetical protein